ncbi:MAG: TRAP transporter substrate-binding protein DctP [Oscillospiraceae bacterium]|nr:TRAP transporter substrate-binding protein DctP [Oscillospiraceae bacterium]
MRNRRTLPILLLAAILIGILGACGGGGSGGASSGGDDVHKIVISYYSSESIPPGQAILNAAEEAEEKSNGRLQFDTYFSGTYVSKNDTMSALKTGMIDMAPVEATQIASVSVLNQIFNALIQGDVPDRAKIQEVYVKMIDDIPELNGEMLDAVNSFWLYPYVLGGYNIHGNKKIESIDDLKGAKIEAHAQMGQYVNMLGGTAVELDAGDYYNGLMLGTVDSQICHWAIVNNSQLNEVVKYHTVFGATEVGSGLNIPAMGYLINKDKWDSLPADLQGILKEAFIGAAAFIFASDAATYEKAVNVAKEDGHEFSYITGAAKKPWADAMQPILDDWFSQCEAAGYDGRGAYEKMIQMFASA